MKARYVYLSLLVVLLLLGSATPAFAHRPIWGAAEGITSIPSIKTSFAAYRDLAGATQVDLYVLDVQAGDHLHAGVNIPAVAGLEHYGVSLAVYGPGLPSAEGVTLPAQMPGGLGALVFPSAAGNDFFEPFTQTNYWGRQRVEVTLPESGTYYLLVWHPQGLSGKYVLDTGTAEVFGPLDLFEFPVWWVKVHWFFGHGPYILGVLGLGLVLIGWRLWAKRRA